MSIRSLCAAAMVFAFAAGAAHTASWAADKTADRFYLSGQQTLARKLAQTPNTGRAKNVILFIGDGMGVNSVTAGRVLTGQRQGKDGVSYVLSFEALPYTALSKTYPTNNLVSDSANGISAITTGVKTINGAVGVDGSVKSGQCEGVAEARVFTIAEQAKRQGRSAGVVTTAGITDATPTGAYGHSSTRGWRSDADLSEEARAAGCIDFARQLVEAPDAMRMDVAFGGDLKKFLPVSDPRGVRKDGRDLTAEWAAHPGAAFVSDQAGLAAIDAALTGPVLGLFAAGDLPSPVDHVAGVPRLDEMTGKAIDILSQNPNGYFLIVESASIDKWHHSNKAYRGLYDVGELDRAVQVALDRTSAEDTLIIVTADHSHGLAFSGYAPRGAPITGLARNDDGSEKLDGNKRPYPILSYVTGPGAASHPDVYTEAEVEGPDFVSPAIVPMGGAAHGGEDVPVYASGPQAYLLTSTVESSFIYQVMAYALGVTPDEEKPVQ